MKGHSNGNLIGTTDVLQLGNKRCDISWEFIRDFLNQFDTGIYTMS